MKLTVFLGGTCGSSTWREKLFTQLSDNIQAFNPVVPDWTPECQELEDYHKANDDVNLFVITPETNSSYSLFEIGVEATKRPKRTVVCFLDNENGTLFEGQQAKAVKKITEDLKNMGVSVYNNLEELANDLNRVAEYYVIKSEEENR